MNANQLEIFDPPPAWAKKDKPRDVNREAKQLLDRAGISACSKDVKALIVAKLMADEFPDMHKALLLSLATTIIKPVETK